MKGEYNHGRTVIITSCRYLGSWAILLIYPGSRSTFFPGGGDTEKFWKIAVTKMKSSMRARPSPTHRRLPAPEREKNKMKYYWRIEKSKKLVKLKKKKAREVDFIVTCVVEKLNNLMALSLVRDAPEQKKRRHQILNISVWDIGMKWVTLGYSDFFSFLVAEAAPNRIRLWVKVWSLRQNSSLCSDQSNLKLIVCIFLGILQPVWRGSQLCN